MQTTHNSATATRVNLGPLTTTFSPPSDCTSLRFITKNEVFMGASIGYGCYDIQTRWVICSQTSIDPDICSQQRFDSITYFPCNAVTTSDKYHGCAIQVSATNHDFSLINSCFPSGFASSFGQTDDNIGNWTSQPLVYSPGLACPSGYWPQCTVERVKGLPDSTTTITMALADNAIWSMLNDDETAIGCCPSGYVCDSKSPHICNSRPHTGHIAITDGISCGGAETTNSIPSTALTAQAMKILLIQSNTPTSISATKESHLPKPKFGKEARIAVGVAVPIIVFLIGAALIYLLRRKKLRSALDREVSAGGGVLDTTLKPELQGSTGIAMCGPKGTTFNKPELDDTGLVELPTGDDIQELHGNSSRTMLNSVNIPNPELRIPIRDGIVKEVEQKSAERPSKQEAESAARGLWDWSNFNTLGKPDEPARTSLTGTRK